MSQANVAIVRRIYRGFGDGMTDPSVTLDRVRTTNRVSEGALNGER
jgi:hypothetical protein